MNREKYREHLQSTYWRNLQYQKSQQCDYKCEQCGGRGIEVHHKHYNTLGHETLEDIELLCDKCHSLKLDTMKFSKHKGRTIRWCLENDAQFFVWLYKMGDLRPALRRSIYYNLLDWGKPLGVENQFLLKVLEEGNESPIYYYEQQQGRKIYE